MIITLGGEKFALRATMLAIEEAEQKEGLKLHKLEGLVDTSKMLYYFAKHGARAEGEKFTYTVKAWLDLIDLQDVHYLTTVLNSLMGSDDSTSAEGKKKGEP
jgi:hypothetical protein